MFSLPWKNSRPGVVGLQFSPEGVALAYADGNCERPSLQGCEWLRGEEGEWPVELLRERVEQLELSGRSCNVVLAAGRYNLLLVEAPNVPEEELRDAVRFRIKDMIDLPLEEALVDVFPLPADSNRSGRKMVYVVVAARQEVMKIIELVEDLELRLNAIDISELALRNLLERLQQGSRGVAGMHLLAGKGLLTLLRDGQLYLSRQLDLTYRAGLLEDLPVEQLILELQRSLDYYERQMGQVPPDSVYLFGENVSPDKISEELRGGISAAVSELPLSEVINVQSPIDDALLQLCVTAIGATLRRAEAA